MSALSTRLSTLRRFIQTQSNSRMANIFALLQTIISYLLSWRTLLFLLAITNLKSLPYSWHIRLYWGIFRNGRSVSYNRARLASSIRSLRALPSTRPKPVHPVFRPYTITTHAPLAEIDYNLHKSNSTYFIDLDHSRSKLVASLIGAAVGGNALVPYGIKRGILYPILGSVHLSFLREIKPYERYEVRSRLLGWDRKWLVIASYFVRRATKSEIEKERKKNTSSSTQTGHKGRQEVVFACALNKYVVKSGRLTVPPELCLAGAGWFDVREDVVVSVKASLDARTSTGGNNNNETQLPKGPLANLSLSETDSQAASSAGTGTATPTLGPEPVIIDAADTVQRVAMEAGRRLSVTSATTSAPATKKQEQQEEEAEQTATITSRDGWSWEEIDTERRRGLKIAEAWLSLDASLKTEYDEDFARGIVGGV